LPDEDGPPADTGHDRVSDARGGSDGVPPDSVEVDVLVGEDGVARGVRLAM
jgi:hypothetical protein